MCDLITMSLNCDVINLSEMGLRWLSLYLPDDMTILVPVMAWCCQATSYYLSQCWPVPCHHIIAAANPSWVTQQNPQLVCWVAHINLRRCSMKILKSIICTEFFIQTPIKKAYFVNGNSLVAHWPVFGNGWVNWQFYSWHLVTGWPLDCYMVSLDHNKLTHWPLGDIDAILKLQF